MAAKAAKTKQRGISEAMAAKISKHVANSAKASAAWRNGVSIWRKQYRRSNDVAVVMASGVARSKAAASGRNHDA